MWDLRGTRETSSRLPEVLGLNRSRGSPWCPSVVTGAAFSKEIVNPFCACNASFATSFAARHPYFQAKCCTYVRHPFNGTLMRGEKKTQA